MQRIQLISLEIIIMHRVLWLDFVKKIDLPVNQNLVRDWKHAVCFRILDQESYFRPQVVDFMLMLIYTLYCAHYAGLCILCTLGLNGWSPLGAFIEALPYFGTKFTSNHKFVEVYCHFEYFYRCLTKDVTRHMIKMLMSRNTFLLYSSGIVRGKEGQIPLDAEGKGCRKDASYLYLAHQFNFSS